MTDFPLKLEESLFMKILLTGANGQLGSDLRIALSEHTVVAATRQGIGNENYNAVALDVTDAVRLREVMAVYNPDLLLNTTAYNKVDAAETDAREALLVNAFAAQQLARVCREFDTPLVHISTDFVFDGAKRGPYIESDLPNPLSAYGASKHAGELLVRAAWRKHYVIRTCGLYGVAGSSGKGGNFVNTMLRMAREGKPLTVVDDQVCTPTSTVDLARQIVRLIEHTGGQSDYGVYHMNDHGQCSWYGFASEIFRLAGVSANLSPIHSVDYNAPAMRPLYSVLQNARLQELGIDQMRDWRAALGEYLGGGMRG